jgi:hypothetical protein
MTCRLLKKAADARCVRRRRTAIPRDYLMDFVGDQRRDVHIVAAGDDQSWQIKFVKLGIKVETPTRPTPGLDLTSDKTSVHN